MLACLHITSRLNHELKSAVEYPDMNLIALTETLTHGIVQIALHHVAFATGMSLKTTKQSIVTTAKNRYTHNAVQ